MQNISFESEIILDRNRGATVTGEPATEPYLEATLDAPQTELDLSGTTPFRLRITAMLHAQSPLLCYVADTFLWPQNALRAGGINFTKLSSEPRPVKRSTVSINTGNFSDRPWLVNYCLLFQPQEPVIIEIPFGSLRDMGVDPPAFDVRFWIGFRNRLLIRSYIARYRHDILVALGECRRASRAQVKGSSRILSSIRLMVDHYRLARMTWTMVFQFFRRISS